MSGVGRRLARRLQERLREGAGVALGPTRAGYALAMALWCLGGVLIMVGDARFVTAWDEAVHRAERVPAVAGSVLTVREAGAYGLYVEGPGGAGDPVVRGPSPRLRPEREGARAPDLIPGHGIAYSSRDARGQHRYGRIVLYGEHIEAGRYRLEIAGEQAAGATILVAPVPSDERGAGNVFAAVAAGCGGVAVLGACVIRSRRRRHAGWDPSWPPAPSLRRRVLMPVGQVVVAVVLLIVAAEATSTGYGSYSVVGHFPLPPLFVIGGNPTRDAIVAVLLMWLVPWQLFRLARHLRSDGRRSASTLTITLAAWSVAALVALAHFTLIEPLARWTA
ncbi:hypothetical protein ACFXEL_06860 [Streptomyces sp. NPDC059382]|uniref:hypothetical protein n=1 Tax=Streptomyces sp. NPDC059382 TaxID=3346816 RepID=UPI0036C24984